MTQKLPTLPHVQSSSGQVPQSGTASGAAAFARELASGTIANADVDALEDVAEINVAAYETLGISFTVATAALTDFNVDFRFHASGDYVTVASVAADYTAPEGPILGASGDLTTAGTSGTHWIMLDVRGVETVRIQAAGTSSVIAGHYGAN